MINKRVLHIVGGMDLGGTETMIMNLFRKVHNEVEFDFISYYEEEGYYDKEIESLGGKVIRTESPNKIGQIRAAIDLYKIIKKENYEVVHAHTLFNCGISMFMAKLAGAKVRISHAHTNLDMGSSTIRKLYYFIMRSLIKLFSTDYLACSDSAGRYLFGESIIKNNRYKVIPNYIEYEKILNCNDTTSIRKELNLTDKDKLIVHIGRFVDAKNHEFLIDILNNIISKERSVKAILIGDGELKKTIENKVKNLSLGKNIFFLGLRNDIENILNNSDLFIFPSIYEGLGLVLLEAQAAGLPCLVSEAIQPEADLHIKLINRLSLKNDINLWGKLALELINSKNKDHIKTKNAFKNKGYDLESIIEKLLQIYKIEK